MALKAERFQRQILDPRFWMLDKDGEKSRKKKEVAVSPNIFLVFKKGF